MNVTTFSDDLKSMSLEECLQKHETNLSTAIKIMKKCNLKTTGIRGRYNTRKKDLYNICEVNGHYTLRKYINGETVNFGTYFTVDDALCVRKALENADWDIEQLPSILKKHRIRRSVCNSKNADLTYIYDNEDGTFTVAKNFRTEKGYRKKLYGRYASLEEAQIIRDELIFEDWNKDMLESIQKKYKITTVNGR